MDRLVENGVYECKCVCEEVTLLVKVRETPSTIKFEPLDQKPMGLYGGIEQFLYEKPIRTVKKRRSGHAIRFWGDGSFTLYPWRAGIPYVFTPKNKSDKLE